MFLTGIYTESFSVLNLHRQTDSTQIHNLICYVTMNDWKSALHEVWSLESSTICPVCESSRSKWLFIWMMLNDVLKESPSSQHLQQAANSIVCTDAGPLLSHVFNITPSTARPLSFPPPACNTAQRRCTDCIRRSRCPASSRFTECNIKLPLVELIEQDRCILSPSWSSSFDVFSSNLNLRRN